MKLFGSDQISEEALVLHRIWSRHQTSSYPSEFFNIAVYVISKLCHQTYNKAVDGAFQNRWSRLFFILVNGVFWAQRYSW